MTHRILKKNSQDEVTSLFTSVFTSSEGEKEGRLIGDLAFRLSSGIDNEKIVCCGSYKEDSIIGSIFFTRLGFDEAVRVYLLAPVGVSTEHQGKGVGQALIKYGLQELKRRSVDVVITYGDPSFYSKVGFRTLAEACIKAPQKLSMPEGWLGLSLTEKPIPVVDERPTCVEEFNDPALW